MADLHSHQWESERGLFRACFEASPGLHLVLHPDDFEIVAVSNAYLQATYTRRETIIGERLFDVFPDNPNEENPDGTRNLRSSLERTKATGETHRMPLQRYPIKNPHTQRFEERFWSPVNVPVIEDGQLAFIIHTVEDATLSHRFFSALESMTDAFYLLDANFCFAYVNRVAEIALQRKAEELIGRYIWEAFPEAVQTELYTYYEQAYRSGISAHFEFYFPPLDDWFEVNAYPSEGGLAVYFRVVTERINLEKQLREAEERFRLAVQATLDNIWDWDLVHDRIYWNDGVADVFGHLQTELQPGPDSWTTRIHPDDLERVLESIHAVIEAPNQTVWQTEYRFARGDGTWATVDDRGSVVRDATGKAVRMVGGITDMTEKNIAKQKLNQAQRMESIGQLTGGLAHDFNNLLTIIIGNADLLSDELAQDHRLLPLAKTIFSAAQKGADLTQRLLTFARKQVLIPELTDANALIQNMLPLLNRTLGDHILVTFKPAQASVFTLVDSSQLESALLNLCLNARDAMQNGGKLTLTTDTVEIDDTMSPPIDALKPGTYLMICVLDTGTGIPEEVIANVFDPFFTTKDVSKGTGLGLSVVYGFARQSAGHVTLYSEVGLGTCVKLYLPLQMEKIPKIPTLKTTTSQIGADKGQGTILIVEDNTMVRDQVAVQLQRAGYDILSAANGDQALAILSQQVTIDLLFTDLMMPSMSGFELAKHAYERRPLLPVLFTSGYSDETTLMAKVQQHNAQILAKPYRHAELLKHVREALNGRK